MAIQTDQINQNHQTEPCNFFKTMAETLSQSDDYQVLKRFDPVKQYNADTDDEGTKLIGIYLDTETTGLDYKTDKIIELALVPFEYNPDGRIFRILDSYSGFQDPGVELNEQITLLTGIADEMVRGQVIDNNQIESMVQSSSIYISKQGKTCCRRN
jgi:DNA polymerase-3 subunit epsilon